MTKNTQYNKDSLEEVKKRHQEEIKEFIKGAEEVAHDINKKAKAIVETTSSSYTEASDFVIDNLDRQDRFNSDKNKEQIEKDKEVAHEINNKAKAIVDTTSSSYTEASNFVIDSMDKGNQTSPIKEEIQIPIDYSKLELKREHTFSSIVTGIQLSKDGKRYYISLSEKGILVTDKNFEEINVGLDKYPYNKCISENPVNSDIITYCRDNVVSVYDIKNQKLVFEYKNNDYLSSTNFSSDGKYIVSGGHDGMVKIYDIKNQKLVFEYRNDDPIFSANFSPDGEYVVSGGYDGIVKIYDIKNQNLVFEYKNSKSITSANFSPDGKYVVSGGYDRVVKIYDIENQNLVFEYKNESAIFSANFSPDGSYIIIGEERIVKIYDIKKKQLVFEIKNEGPIFSSDFSPDGKQIIISGKDRKVKIFEIKQ